MTDSEKFKNMYFTNYKLELEKLKMLDEKEDIETKIELLKECIKKQDEFIFKYPIILEDGHLRISIFNIGREEIKHNTTTYIILKGFLSKRKVQIEDRKVLVTCKITREGPKISAEGKKEWKGDNFWENFIKDIDFVEEKTYLDFFGISNVKYQVLAKKFIEFKKIMFI